MIRRLFLDHPESVGETFTEHFHVASSFGLTMIAAGCASVIHAFVPALFKTTGSRTVGKLNQRIVDMRAAKAADEIQRKTVEYVI